MTDPSATPQEFFYRRGAMAGALVIGVVMVSASLGLIWLRYPFASGVQFSDSLLFFSLVFFGAMSCVAIWFVAANPVAIRLDAAGVTGRHIPDFGWSDVRALEPAGEGRYAGIGVRFENPRRVTSSWSLWEKRFLLKLPSRYTIVFLTGPILASREDLLTAMGAFLHEARR